MITQKVCENSGFQVSKLVVWSREQRIFLVKCEFKIIFATLWRLIYAKIALKHVYNFGVGSFCKPVVIFKRFFCVCFANHKGGMVQLPYNCQVGQPWGPIKCLILAINFSEIMTNKNKIVIVPIFIVFKAETLAETIG